MDGHMKVDVRLDAAKFYDLNPDTPNDIPFYRQFLTSRQMSILELGCGTGRVTLALAPYCGYIHGIDISSAMVTLCREKLAKAGLPSNRVYVEEGDITDFNLGKKFDFIIAPFRVLQNIERDEEVTEMFRCIRQHLAPHGTCILNVFRPLYAPQDLRERWQSTEEHLSWEAALDGGKIACHDRRARLDAEKLILYPELIYRRYEGERLAEEATLKIAMRCYYAETFEKLVNQNGFAIFNRWGGYAGEAYGEGTELVLQFGVTELC
jgi:SAM-dependent methyltransferase